MGERIRMYSIHMRWECFNDEENGLSLLIKCIWCVSKSAQHIDQLYHTPTSDMMCTNNTTLPSDSHWTHDMSNKFFCNAHWLAHHPPISWILPILSPYHILLLYYSHCYRPPHIWHHWRTNKLPLLFDRDDKRKMYNGEQTNEKNHCWKHLKKELVRWGAYLRPIRRYVLMN